MSAAPRARTAPLSFACATKLSRRSARLFVRPQLRELLVLELPLARLLLCKLLASDLLHFLGRRLFVERKREPCSLRRLAPRALQLDVQAQLVGRVRVAYGFFVGDVPLV